MKLNLTRVGRSEDMLLRHILWFGEPWTDGTPGLHIELAGPPRSQRGSKSLGAEFEFGGDDRDLTVNVSAWWWFLHLGLSGVFPREWRREAYRWA